MFSLLHPQHHRQQGVITFTVMCGAVTTITHSQLLQLYKCVHVTTCLIKTLTYSRTDNFVVFCSQEILQHSLFFLPGIQELLCDWAEILSGRGHHNYSEKREKQLIVVVIMRNTSFKTNT